LQQREIDALKRACLYSFIPNKLGYCGPPGSWEAFLAFISNPSEEQAPGVKQLLLHFFALHPYLELIAKANEKSAFDPEIIEAYWIGSDLLRNVQFRETQKTILSFQRSGLPRSIAEKKAACLPDGLLPHHSFHVLYVNFISKKVPPLIENLGNCLIQWAEVKSESEKGIEARGIGLFSEGGEFKIQEKAKKILDPFKISPKAGDFVSVHWGNAIEMLSEESLESLKKFTLLNLAALTPQRQ